MNHPDQFWVRFLMQLPHPLPQPVAALKEAAVLVLFLEREDQPHLLLTRRSQELNHHPGQVAFAGGKRDPSDASLTATALREAHEELGIDPKLITVVGKLPTINTRTGFAVTPIVAQLKALPQLTLNPAEIDYLFEVPLEPLLELEHYAQLRIRRGETVHDIPFFKAHPEMIWGVTAQILESLAKQVQE